MSKYKHYKCHKEKCAHALFNPTNICVLRLPAYASRDDIEYNDYEFYVPSRHAWYINCCKNVINKNQLIPLTEGDLFIEML